MFSVVIEEQLAEAEAGEAWLDVFLHDFVHTRLESGLVWLAFGEGVVF